jgi:hypothetical protein
MILKYHFCNTCGTKIYKEGDQGAFLGMANVQAGTLDKDCDGKSMGIADLQGRSGVMGQGEGGVVG